MKEESNNNKVKEVVVKVKTYVEEMPRSRKIIAAIVLVAMIAAAVIITATLNSHKQQYTVLYDGLSQQETSEVYVALKQKGADAKLNENGQIVVPSEQYDIWLLQMAAEGYPQSTLAYNVFSDNTGLTTTESEKQTWLINQLQDRIQQTLKSINGVNNAVVTITTPEATDYVWQQASDNQVATASVLLTLAQDADLSTEQVTAIKNLVAASVNKLEPEQVRVINAGTGMELKGNATSTDGNGLTTEQNLSLEQEVQKQIEDNVERLLSARYGVNGVVAAAKVTLNYDAMMTETLTPTESQDGNGYLTRYTEGYGINGYTAAGGLVGEEDNTDIPQYSYTSPDTEGGMTEYHRDMQYDYGYIKTQVEKGNAVLSRATISVLVDESNLDTTRQQELISLISNATDIAPAYITVSAMDAAALTVPTQTDTQTQTTGLPIWVFIAIGVGVLLLILIIVVLILRRRRRQADETEELETEDLAAEELSEADAAEQEEIDAYKRELEDAAKSAVDKKDEALVNDIRNFAKENPEITAALLRNWLKEGEE